MDKLYYEQWLKDWLLVSNIDNQNPKAGRENNTMSFQNTSDVDSGNVVKILDKSEVSDMERFIINCCKAPEWEIRKWLKKVLIRAGFEIQEDNYLSERCQKDNRYNSIHNMLAIRGENPRVCLVAHTDVCRDHEELRSDSRYNGEQYWMENHSNTATSERGPRKVDPVVKIIETTEGLRRIIQSRNCDIQVGADDRLGVAINTYIALNTGLPMGLFFPSDEEIGLRSARACEMQRLKDFDICVQVDRGNHSNQLVIKIGGEVLCTYDHAVRLLDIAFTGTPSRPREVVTGMHTDIYALKSKGLIKNAVNLTCGYHNSYGAGSEELIDLEEAKDTLRFVSDIVKDYYLND